jgi:branched-chain amino acid transport system substrate-binding protein
VLPIIRIFAIIIGTVLLLEADAQVEESLPSRLARIGVLVPLTGPVAAIGTEIKQAVQLADEDYDLEGNVSFIFEDDQFSPKQAVNALEKLVSSDTIDSIITFSGSVSLAVSGIAERRELPMIAITPLQSVSAGRRYVYTLSLSTAEIIRLIAAKVQAGEYKTVAIISTTQDAIVKMKEELRLALVTPFSLEIEVAPQEVDLRTIVDKVLRRSPDVILNFLLPPQLAIFSRAIHERGYKGAIVGPPPLYNPSEISGAHGGLTGAIVTFPHLPAENFFLERYRERFGYSCSPEAMYAYDAAMTLIKAARTPSTANFLMRTFEIEGISGRYRRNVDRHFDVPGALVSITPSGGVSSIYRP